MLGGEEAVAIFQIYSVQKSILERLCMNLMVNSFGFSVFEFVVLVITMELVSGLVTPPMLCSSFI